MSLRAQQSNTGRSINEGSDLDCFATLAKTGCIAMPLQAWQKNDVTRPPIDAPFKSRWAGYHFTQPTSIEDSLLI